jgi:N-formylmaleamate deformylase
VTNWATAVCKSNGIDIHYIRTGGSKPPLVLLHGLTGSGACWTPLARALEAEFDVVMPDARGHGNSSTPASGYLYDDYASDVLGLIEELGLAAPVLLGHSMGGMTAAIAASRAAAPIRGIILADPTFLSPQRQREVHESDVVEQHRRLLKLDRAEALAQARTRHPHRSSNQSALKKSSGPFYNRWQICSKAPLHFFDAKNPGSILHNFRRRNCMQVSFDERP